MPGIVPARRSYSSVEADDNSNEDQLYSDDATPRLVERNKRARLELDSDTRTMDVTTNSWALSPPPTVIRRRYVEGNSHQDSANALADQAPGVTSLHQPGSIVRVTLHNFVTYTSASFLPGPALNMVIGPNGTGKSTLVCAICLGLGWGPKHLGRAKDVGEFVKHGSSEATIEIELKGRPGKRNPVIKRTIKREGNKSSYFLNGEMTNQNSVLSLARGFSIQIDNLCQFLPQDRVVEFAGLSPVLLLDSTQRAAAPAHMIEWHDELKGLRVDQKNAEKEQANLKQNLTNLEGRQNLQRADVERIREREELVEKVALLENLRPFAEAFVAQAAARIATEQRRTAITELEELRRELNPGLRAVNDKQKYEQSIDKVVTARKKLALELEKQVDKTFEAAKTMRTKIEECAVKKASEVKNDRKRKADVATALASIREIEAALREEPISFDPAEYNERIRVKVREQRDLRDQSENLSTTVSERKAAVRDKQGRVERAKRELEDLQSKAGQQMGALRNHSADTAKAWEWIQQNRRRFQGEVYGPPMVECSVTDKKFVPAIESLMQRGQCLAITCTNQTDFKILQDELYRTMGLSDVFCRMINLPSSHFRAPISQEEMARFGLQSWALDHVTGPDPVLSLLCEEARLHDTGVMEQDCSDAQFEELQRSNLRNWVTKTSYYKITKRKEYEGYASTRVVSLQPARFWTDQPVDTRAEQDLKDNIEGWSSEVVEMKRQNDQTVSKLRDIQQLISRSEEEQRALRVEKDEKQRARGHYDALPVKLQTHQEKLEKLNEEEANLRQRIADIRDEETKLILKKGQLSIDYSKLVETLRSAHTQLVVACVAQIEAKSDFEELSLRNEAVKNLLHSREQEVQELGNKAKELREKLKGLTRALNGHYERHPGLKEFYDALPEAEKVRTPEELNLEIDAQKARLELLHEGDPRAVREFEERAKQIERLQRHAADNTDTLVTLEQSIATLRAKWEPELDALIAKISTAFASSFQKINCAGEVTVHKEGDGGRDFEGWAVHISVKFRENEELSLLDSHRQSGGERAVSTIFYLMALQSLSQAPFRVVDEINQGMDPRNERMVHERMVDIACGSAPRATTGEDEQIVSREVEPGRQGSQYFLITPKLLSDLKYSPGMKVHCIASGEYMPKDYKELDFRELLEKAKGVFGSRNTGLVDRVGA